MEKSTQQIVEETRKRRQNGETQQAEVSGDIVPAESVHEHEGEPNEEPGQRSSTP